nr:MAG TPA: hypothetical protein [Caudoviricetes sp.]
MLGYYIKSTIVFLIIYFASNKAIKTLLQNRNEIDYKKYTKKDNKEMWYTFCFIPILRVIVLLAMYWLTIASKEDLDKIFDKKED